MPSANATMAVTPECEAPVSSTSRNGPRPLMNTGAQMRPIWSRRVGATKRGSRASTMISASCSAACSSGVGGETVGAVPTAHRALKPSAQIIRMPASTLRRGFVPDQKRGAPFIICTASLFQPCRDVGLDHLGQHRQRYRARAQQQIMKTLHREPRTERLLRAGSLRKNLEFANLIRACLAGHYDITLDFRGRNSVIDGLLPGPMLCMQPGIDHQSPRAEQFIGQLPQATFRIVAVPVGLHRELFRIQTPALRKGRQPAEHPFAAKYGYFGGLLLQSNLEMVTRHAFVIHQRSHLQNAIFRSRQRYPHGARPRAVGGRRRVMRSGIFFRERRLSQHLYRRLWPQIEQT